MHKLKKMMDRMSAFAYVLGGVLTVYLFGVAYVLVRVYFFLKNFVRSQIIDDGD